MVSLNKEKYFYYPDTNTIINREFKSIYIKNNQKEKIQFEDVRIDHLEILSRIRDLKQVIIEITQSCGMQCKYCAYSGIYYYNRIRSSQSINFRLAKSGIDYIYQFIKKRKIKEFSIGFYGGEPLLEFAVVKEIVNYAKKLFKRWKLRFNVTTNGTLMNDSIIDFFIENEFNVTVSLDGPKENHDSKRVFPDGNGSFQVVIDNLEKIKKKDETFYYNNISFFAVHSNDLSLEKLYLFFKENDLVNKNSLRFGRVNSLDTDYYKKYPYDKWERKHEFGRIFDIIKKKLKNDEMLYPVETAIFQDIPQLMDILKTRRMNMLAGSCFFDNRLYIDAGGRFHICEKINDKFSFGDVNTGFDLEKMEKFLRDYTELIKKNCLNCDVRFLCRRCYIQFAKDGEFSIDPLFCENRKNIFYRLEKLIELKEENII